ncbi:predicted protein [Methanosarcina acetivorans C2A]|uniref:Uncharacterized protein n=1 Tax=Methanosarcina acetivorans (strain ATCC 35395 / DSM 2834 / JCM 12185 / C2A) TaxID=188937 RepID=Q8TK80_METAC|nr:predicted protein [Methanosarcina acetivorans C2A]
MNFSLIGVIKLKIISWGLSFERFSIFLRVNPQQILKGCTLSGLDIYGSFFDLYGNFFDLYGSFPGQDISDHSTVQLALL